MKKLTVTKKLLYTAIVLAVVVASLEGATRLVLREPEPLPSYEVIPAHIGRDDETTYDKPDGVLRIVIVGDSNTFGYGVTIRKHFTWLLEGYFDRVQVINLGVAGYGIDQELMRLRAEGFRYEPDVVLAYVPHYADDRHLHTHRFGRNKARFVLEDGKLVLDNVPVPRDAPGDERSGMETGDASTGKRGALIRSAHQFCLDHSRLYRVVTNKLDHAKLHRKLQNMRDKAGSARQASHNDAPPGPVAGDTPASPPTGPSQDPRVHTLGHAIIHAMHEECVDRDVQFALVTKIDRLHEYAVGHDIRSLNVSAQMGNAYYRIDDVLGHINESGNGALALAICTYLIDQRLIPQSHVRSADVVREEFAHDR